MLNKTSQLITFVLVITRILFFVCCLFFICCPSAIIRKITKSVINSVDSVFRGRWFSHVGKEIIKFFPTGTNRYTTFAIFKIRTIIRVVASSNHALPYSINTSFRHAMSFVAALTTTSTFSSTEVVNANRFNYAAIALT